MTVDYELSEADDERLREIELKTLFANAWLKTPRNPFEAANSICNGNGSQAVHMATMWVYDAEVLDIKKQLLTEHGEEYFLPSKVEMLHDILDRARTTHADDDFVKLMKLAADMRGMLSDKTSINVNNNVVNNKVMMVPVFMNSKGNVADDSEWERGLIEQQQRLVEQ